MISLSIFIAIILNSLYDELYISISSGLVSEDLFCFFLGEIFFYFFIFFDFLCCYLCIRDISNTQSLWPLPVFMNLTGIGEVTKQPNQRSWGCLYLHASSTCSLFLASPRSQKYIVSHQCVQTSETEASSSDSSWKIWDVGYIDHLLLSPGKSWELRFLIHLLSAEPWGGNIITASLTHHL